MYLGGPGSQPIFLKNGMPVSTVACGDTITYNVPGYTAIWLEQTQNGIQQYAGRFELPMQPYTLDCGRDLGVFQQTAWELTAQGGKGALIGTAAIMVTNPNGTQIPIAKAVAAPVPPQNTVPVATGYAQPTVITIPGGSVDYVPAAAPPVSEAGLFGGSNGLLLAGAALVAVLALRK